MHTNSLRGVRKPPGRCRGTEAVLSDEHLRTLWTYCAAWPPRRWFWDLLTVLYRTGARPGEILAATAQAFSAPAGTLIYHGQSCCWPFNSKLKGLF